MIVAISVDEFALADITRAVRPPNVAVMSEAVPAAAPSPQTRNVKMPPPERSPRVGSTTTGGAKMATVLAILRPVNMDLIVTLPDGDIADGGQCNDETSKPTTGGLPNGCRVMTTPLFCGGVPNVWPHTVTSIPASDCKSVAMNLSAAPAVASTAFGADQTSLGNPGDK